MITRLFIFVLLALPAFSQNAARYPTTITTFQDLAFARDAPNKSQLTASINNVTLTATVADGTLFRPFNLLTFSDTGEQVMVCTILVNDLQLCGRGFGGTSPTFHSSGVILSGNVTAWHHNQLAAEVIAIQSALGTNLSNIPTPSWATLSGRPTALSAFTNDTGFLTSLTGVTWANISGHPTALSEFSNDSGYFSGSYSDPSWLSITKAKVGLGNVENTALSTTLAAWTGSTNITNIGTLTTAVSVSPPAWGSPHAAIKGSWTVASDDAIGLWGGATANNSYYNTGVYATASGTGTSGNYGVKIDVANASLNYSLYSANTAKSYHRGGIQIGGGSSIMFSSILNVQGVPVYTTNATAKTGGLQTGDVYRTGTDPDQLCVVH